MPDYLVHVHEPPRGVVQHRVSAADAAAVAGALGVSPLLALWVLLSVLPVPRALGLSWRRRLLALGLVLPLAALLAVADPALVLAGSVWQLLVDSAAPDSFSPLVDAGKLLHGGGRFALGLAAAALALALAGALPGVGRAAPASG